MGLKIKICGLTRLKDAEQALELGADALGIVLESSSPRYAGENPEALGIPAAVGPYALCVAVLGPYQQVPAQFHMIQCLPEPGLPARRPLLSVVRVRPGDTLESVLERIGNADAVVLDSHSKGAFGGTGNHLDWGIAKEVVEASRAKVVLAGGLTPENVASAIEQVHPYAVDVSSGVESSPGIKDAEKLKAFFASARG